MTVLSYIPMSAMPPMFSPRTAGGEAAEALPQADFISVHLPMTGDQGIIGAQQFAAMKKSRSLSRRRAALIDEAAWPRRPLRQIRAPASTSSSTSRRRPTIRAEAGPICC